MVRCTHSFAKARIFLESSSSNLYNTHFLDNAFFCKVGTANCKVGTGLSGPIRVAANGSVVLDARSSCCCVSLTVSCMWSAWI